MHVVLSRQWSLRNKYQLSTIWCDCQFRAEVFNLLNRANFGLPDNFVGSPTFGKILSADNPRRVQLGLKLLF